MAVLKNINFKISNSWVDMGNLVYPVGSIFQSTSSTSPATMFGGTWERIKDKFLLSAGDSYAAAATGGEAEHTLTVNEMPRHTHYFRCNYFNQQASQSLQYGNYPIRLQADSASNWNDDELLGTRGADQPHNNMPPYVAVYCWKRTA